MSGPDDLVPLNNLVQESEDPQQSGFDVVFGRGYDRRQVEDYVERVYVAIAEADARHAEDLARLAAGEQQFNELRERLADAEARAAGLPETPTRVGERLARMLALADEEAGEIRSRAHAEAQALLQQARQQVEAESAARTAALEQREQDIAGAGEQADRLRLEAQQDAQTVRAAAQRDAEAFVEHARQEAHQTVQQAQAHAQQERAQAEQDVRAIHEGARDEAARMTHEARRQVRELSAQRDAIAGQLQSLRDTLSGAFGPLAAAGPDEDPRQQDPRQQDPRGGSVRTTGPDRT
jgi:cell division septum initiation protein DivIVA